MRRQALPAVEYRRRETAKAVVGGIVAVPVLWALFIALVVLGTAGAPS